MLDSTIKDWENSQYPFGFETKISQRIFRPGIDIEKISQISTYKNEPEWLLDWRVKAFKFWQKSKQPTWANLKLPRINFQKISYFAEPVNNPKSIHGKRVILCDIDGVVLTPSRLKETLLEKFKIEDKKDIFKDFFHSRFRKVVCGQSDLQKELAPVLKKLGWQKSGQDFLKLWLEVDFNLNQRVVTNLKSLKDHGYKIYAYTQQAKERSSFLKKNLKNLFDGWFVSYNLKTLKTDPLFFEKVLKKLNLSGSQVVVIDDSLKNLTAPKNFGAKTILFKDNLDLQKEVQKIESEVDPELQKTFEKLGISLSEQKKLQGIAQEIIFDSVSVQSAFTTELTKLGIIFCSISEAVLKYPDLVKKYLGSVVPYSDNFYASLNSAVFTDGSFAYIPKNIRCPMELSTYFRINAVGTGQFERTLLIADEGSYVSYLEGCTAPRRDTNQLHCAVVELIALENAEIKYSTVQNWYPGDEKGRGGVLNLVTKRGVCLGKNSKISWTQVETGSAITWKYPSVVLKGEGSTGEFYSIALTKNKQQADTGTKMIHIGKKTRSRIVSKGISTGQSKNTFRSLVKITENSENSRNFTQCDSLLLSTNCEALTVPDIQNRSESAILEHEASTGKLSSEALNFLESRGLDLQEASGLIINGYCKEIVKNLPLEFYVEAQKLIELNLENSVG